MLDVLSSHAQSVFFHFILFVLLLACTGNLVPKAVALGEQYRKLSSKISQYIVALHVALVRILARS